MNAGTYSPFSRSLARRALPALLAVLLLPLAAHALPPLQLYVELTPAGGVLHPPPGAYAGPVVIKRPITLDGQGQVTVDGGGEGTVLTIAADGAVVRGLHLTGSGRLHDHVDSAILITANDTLVEDNRIDHSLFGIHLKSANGNTVRNNRVSAGEGEIYFRGDGLRLWYSHENTIEGNLFEGVRDLVFSNSEENRFAGNTIRHSRVGLEAVFSPHSLLENNLFDSNETGMVILYSDEVTIRGNRLMHSRDYAGSCLAFKDSAQAVVEENEILHCAVGLSGNAPNHPENIIYLRRNYFAYNDMALFFYGEKGGHVIHDNRFEGNLTTVGVSAPLSARGHDWQGNYWDTYSGFDRDHDGVGDTPYVLFSYSDRIWRDRPMTRFYRGSPLFEMVDLVERLAPYSEPALVLRDPAPRAQ